MEFEPKAISTAGVPAALEKAKQYRLLNQPEMAESICVDILKVAPDSDEVLVTLLLSATDQFDKGRKNVRTQARRALEKIKGEYEKAYYTGIVEEREARSFIIRGVPGANNHAYVGYRLAMEWYEKAEKLSAADNDDAILRWNTCARFIENEHLEPPPADDMEMAHALE